jgi:uncharacterized membrane protein
VAGSGPTPPSIAVLIGFIGYDIATEGPSFGMIALTLFDIVLTWLAWREWQHHKASGLFDQAADSSGALDPLPPRAEGA